MLTFTASAAKTAWEKQNLPFALCGWSLRRNDMSMIEVLTRGKSDEEKQKIIEQHARIKAKFVGIPKRDPNAPAVPATREQVAKIRQFEAQQQKSVIEVSPDAPF